MRTKSSIWAGFILLVLLSCQKMDPKGNNQTIFKVEFINSIRLSEYFKSLKYVFLEESKDGLFINADKILYFQDRWYILDRELMTIVCFTEGGKFLFRIHSVGKGPGEYQLLTDIMIHQTRQELWAQCKMSRKILIYNLNGKLLREELVDRIGTEFVQMNNSDVIVYDEEGHYMSMTDSIDGGVYLMANNFKARNQIFSLPTESAYYQLKNQNNFSLNDDSCYFLSPSDSLICFPPDLKPVVTGIFDFGAYHLPNNLKNLPIKYENYAKIVESGKVIWKENLVVSNHHIFLNLGFRNSLWYGLINRRNSRFVMTQGFINDICPELFAFPIAKKSKNELVGFLSADHLLAYRESLSKLSDEEINKGSTKSTLSFIEKGLESSGNILVVAQLRTP